MSLLSNSEILGIKTAHLAQVGCFGLLQCSGCDRMEELNCDMSRDDGESVMFSEFIGEYTTCPLNYVPPNVVSFIKRIGWIERYPSSAPKYDEESARFMEALSVLDSVKAEFEDGQKGAKESSDNLAKMEGLRK